MQYFTLSIRPRRSPRVVNLHRYIDSDRDVHPEGIFCRKLFSSSLSLSPNHLLSPKLHLGPAPVTTTASTTVQAEREDEPVSYLISLIDEMAHNYNNLPLV